MVRFATTCDIDVFAADKKPCGARSAEYTTWPACRSCGSHCCPKHQFPGSVHDADLDSPETCLCVECEADEP